MNRRNTLIASLLLMFAYSHSQNNQILFDFDETPQTLLLNPGADFNHDYFISVPFLSGISVQGGYTMFAGLNLLKNPTENNLKTEIRDGLSAYRNEKKYHFNEKVDILYGGIRLKNDAFLSFGFYQELDVTAYYPQDAIPLFFQGSTIDLGNQYLLEDLAFKAEMVGVLHVGLSHKVNDDFTIGGRLKLYSSAFNIQSKNNQGHVNSTLGTNSLFVYHVVDSDMLIQSSGLHPFIEEGKKLRNGTLQPDDIDISKFTKGIYTFQNSGLGIDLGFTYKPNEQLQFSGSVLDIGFIKNSKDILSYSLNGSRDISGNELGASSDVLVNVWNAHYDYLKKLPLKNNFNSFYSYRPIKINLAAKYRFGDFYYDNCYATGYYNDPYKSAIGFQLFSVNTPLKPEIAATIFYEHGLGQHLKAKITYTADSYSYSNIGLGVSTHFGIFNVYLAADNLLQITNIATKANNSSFQFGINLLLDKKYW